MIPALILAGCARGPHDDCLTPPPGATIPMTPQPDLLSAPAPARVAADYQIGPSDIIEIRVFEQDRLSVTSRVAMDGTIRFPPLGVLMVGGLSERGLETMLQDRLRGSYLPDPHVTVFVKELHARVVTIVGEVKAPGLYPIQGNEALIDVISKAGGLTSRSGNTAYVIRAAAETAATAPAVAPTAPIRIDLAGLLMRGEQRWNLPMRAGDRITIPDAGWIHVTGPGVEQPGTYPLRSTHNMLRQYIDEAGGLKFSAGRRLTLIRRSPDGREEMLDVDFKRILKDERNDLLVQGGDTVIVNNTLVRASLSAIGKGMAKVFRVVITVGGRYDLLGSGSGGGGYY